MVTQTYTENQKSIIDYLKQQVSEGKIFFKAKHIAGELNLSSKEVGTNLIKLSKKHNTLKIVAWSKAIATTWRVERKQKTRGKSHDTIL